MLDRFIAWFQSHKTVLGSFCLGVATILAGAASIYHQDALLHHAALIALIGTTLVGAGAAKSDAFYKSQAETIKTRLDRRNPDSLIPVKDLQKLLTEDDRRKTK